MVSTPHYLASQAGVEMLQRGGTEVDAAIAANAVLCVAYPHMAGLGGNGFWLIADGKSEQVYAINASGQAAELATLARYQASANDGEIAARGPQAVLTVPGAIDGWRARERFGRLSWVDLFAPAIGYARDGVPVSRSSLRTSRPTTRNGSRRSARHTVTIRSTNYCPTRKVSRRCRS